MINNFNFEKNFKLANISSLFLVLASVFMIFFKGLKNSNIYTPKTNLEIKVPSFELKSFENNNIISEKNCLMLNLI